MSKQGQVASSKPKLSKTKTLSSTVGLFDLLDQALSEFIHTEHIQPQGYSDKIEECLLNKKQNRSSVDPVIFAFSPVASPPEGLFIKFIELLKSRYLRNLAQIFALRPNDFTRFHRFMVKFALDKPDVLDFMSALAITAAESDPQNIASLFMKNAFNLYSPYFNNKGILSSIVSLVFAHTESDESSRDSRVSQILSCISEEETQYLVLSHTVMQERIFSSRLCDLYSSYIETGLKVPEFQPYSIHILRYLSPIKPEILHSYLPLVSELVGDTRPFMQIVMIQLLVDSSQETLLTQVINNTSRLDVLSLALHLVSELGNISSPLLVLLFKKIGSQNIETVCTERTVIESPVGPLPLGRLTNTWNSAAVNSTVIYHIQNVPLPQWDVEFSLCKLLLKQPMDSASAQIWKQLFAQLAPQFGDLMREEDMADIIFDIVAFYLLATLDVEFFEKLQPSLEPVVTVAKEKCKIAGTKFLTKMAELGPKFKQIVSTLILV